MFATWLMRMCNCCDMCRSVRAHKMMTAKLNATAPTMRSAPPSASGKRSGGYADSSDEDD